jgi:tetratricopeptide (TPR) repeat protein
MLRALASLVIAAAAVGAGAAVAGNLGGVIALALVLLVALAVRLLFARFAHAMFRAGRMNEARRYYRVLAIAAWRGGRRAAAQVSIAATYLGEGDYPRAQTALAAIAPAALEPTTRAGWLNNRAYAALRAGATGAAARAALADARAALALVADVPAVLHTEALALYACGEIDAAIAAWEALWERGELPARLDAERCDDLAAAWERRGEAAYAADYRRRAAAAVPVAPWRAAGTSAA